MNNTTDCELIDIQLISIEHAIVDDKEAQILSICENTARQNLNPIEEGNAYANYLGLNLDSNLVEIPSHGHPGIKELSEQIRGRRQ